MQAAYHRHDIYDEIWHVLESLLPGQRGQWGVISTNNHRYLNGVFWVLRTGVPWRDLPPDYGDWKNTHRRFCRWRDDRDYDANKIIKWATAHGMIAVIPSRKNRLDQRDYDHYLYKIRHLVENAFLMLK